MKDITKYQGIIPAFYACYDDNGEISPERVEALIRHLIAKGVKGVYVQESVFIRALQTESWFWNM